MIKYFVAAIVGAGLAGSTGAPMGMVGDWLTPGGSVVRVAGCGQKICLIVVKLNPGAPETTDKLNPDHALRTRALCGMRIGDGFMAEGDNAASGGKVYDPESGKTYSGKIALDGDRLKLRGYVGVSLFGRSETWKRIPEIQACT